MGNRFVPGHTVLEFSKNWCFFLFQCEINLAATLPALIKADVSSYEVNFAERKKKEIPTSDENSQANNSTSLAMFTMDLNSVSW